MMNTVIKKFTDLNAWKESHLLVLDVYKITKAFPKDEQFALTTQLRRAIVSVTSNISEGFGRFTFKEKARFYYQASGSLSEVENQLIIAKDLGYISPDDHTCIQERITRSYKLLHGLITKTKSLATSEYQNMPLHVPLQSPISSL